MCAPCVCVCVSSVCVFWHAHDAFVGYMHVCGWECQAAHNESLGIVIEGPCLAVLLDSHY